MEVAGAFIEVSETKNSREKKKSRVSIKWNSKMKKGMKRQSNMSNEQFYFVSSSFFPIGLVKASILIFHSVMNGCCYFFCLKVSCFRAVARVKKHKEYNHLEWFKGNLLQYHSHIYLAYCVQCWWSALNGNVDLTRNSNNINRDHRKTIT